MKRFLTVSIVGVLMMLWTTNIFGSNGQPVNGSFEDDGSISDIFFEEPNGWDVFGSSDMEGYVSNQWKTEGNYGLTLYAWYYVNYLSEDEMFISQPVILRGVNSILFDLKLETLASVPWDANLITPRVWLDEQVVWEISDSNEDARGTYLSREIPVDVNDNRIRNLDFSLFVRNDFEVNFYHIIRLDNVRFDCECENNGYLLGDMDGSCCVDEADLQKLALSWLGEADVYGVENLAHEGDIEEYAWVDFRDYAVFVEQSWSESAMNDFSQSWNTQVSTDDPNNYYHGDDIEAAGVINFLDYAEFAKDWWKCSMGGTPDDYIQDGDGSEE